MTPRSSIRTLVTAALSISTTASLFAQGLVNFYNDPNHLVYAAPGSITPPSSPITGPRDSYYFGLLIGPPQGPASQWIFTGIYGTNTGVTGLFSGGTAAVPGWLPGTSTNFIIVGWESMWGPNFSFSFLQGGFPGAGEVQGAGVSGNGSTIPALNPFDPGIIGTGGPFTIYGVVPEPSVFSLIAVGAGMLLILRNTQARAAAVRSRNASQVEANNELSSV